MGKGLVRNVASNWTGMIINMLVAFFMMPFIIHELGNTAYGFWVLLQSLTSYMFLLDFGVRSSLNRHLAKFYTQGEYDETNRVVNTGLVVYLLIGFTVAGLSCLLGFTFHNFFSFQELDSKTIAWAVILVGSSVALRFPTAVFDSVLTGLQRYDLMNCAQILSISIRTMLTLIALKSGYGVVAISWATFLPSLLHLLFTYRLAAWIYPAMQLDFSLSSVNTLKLLAGHSFYAYILIGATRIITDAGIILVGAFVGPAAVTFYAIASSLTTYATSVISGISTTIPPVASELEVKGDQEALHALCISGTKFILLVGLPILFTFILTGQTFISLWVGEEYGRESYPLLILLSLSWAFNYLQAAVACVLMGLSQHKIAAWLVLIQALLNLGLSLGLVRVLGMLGVAWGALIASILMNCIFQVHALRLLSISLRSFLRQAIMPTMVALLPFVLTIKLQFSSSPPDRLLNYFFYVMLAVVMMVLILPWSGLSRQERLFVWGKILDNVILNKLFPSYCKVSKRWHEKRIRV